MNDLALLVLRVVVGGIMIGHGGQKLFGWFGGPGLAGTRRWIGSGMRFRPVTLWALLAGLSEFGGGLLLLLGLLSPLGSLGVIAAMVMAITVHWPKFWAIEHGYEFPLALLAAGVALGLTGPGRFSLDRALGIALPEPASFLVGLALVLLGIIIAFATRAPRPAATTSGDAVAQA